MGARALLADFAARFAGLAVEEEARLLNYRAHLGSCATRWALKAACVGQLRATCATCVARAHAKVAALLSYSERVLARAAQPPRALASTCERLEERALNEFSATTNVRARL